MSFRKLPNVIAATIVAWSLSFNTAQAGPMCTEISETLATFVSCVADGNDDLPSVQAALDDAITDAPTLLGTGSFSPGPESSGTEFMGDTAGLLDIDPDSVGGSIAFEFSLIPDGTEFISIKQRTFFEVFKVPGPTPFTLEHQIDGDSTSHISTFVADLDDDVPPTEIPEPGLLFLMGTGLVAVGLTRRRRRTG